MKPVAHALISDWDVACGTPTFVRAAGLVEFVALGHSGARRRCHRCERALRLVPLGRAALDGCPPYLSSGRTSEWAGAL